MCIAVLYLPPKFYTSPKQISGVAIYNRLVKQKSEVVVVSRTSETSRDGCNKTLTHLFICFHGTQILYLNYLYVAQTPLGRQGRRACKNFCHNCLTGSAWRHEGGLVVQCLVVRASDLWSISCQFDSRSTINFLTSMTGCSPRHLATSGGERKLSRPFRRRQQPLPKCQQQN